MHRHAGIEFLYVLQGKLGLYISDAEVRLSEGDSVYFDSDQLHGYRQIGRAECQALAITVPPSSTQGA